MEKKRFSVLKLIAAIIFILLAGYSAINFVGNIITTVSDLFNGRIYFIILCANLLNLTASGLQVLGFLLLGVSCFMRKPRLLGIAGVAALIVALLCTCCNSFIWDIISRTGIVRFSFLIRVLVERPGRFLRNLFSIYTLIELIDWLLIGLSYVAAAVVLLLDKKGNKILSLVPSAFAIVAPVWYFLASVVADMINGYFNFSAILKFALNCGLGQGLLIAVGFALLCISLPAKAKPAPQETPEVIEEPEVSEEIPAAAESVAE